ncbi:DUF7684 family protein [Planctomycetes bacterium Pla163]
MLRVRIDDPSDATGVLERLPRGYVALVVWDAEHATADELEAFSNALIATNCGCVCAWGDGCEEVEDSVDWTDVMLEVDGTRPPDADGDVLLTSQHSDETFEEALELALIIRPTSGYRGPTTVVAVLEVTQEKYDDLITRALKRCSG